mgnify:CR=1 FL=1
MNQFLPKNLLMALVMVFCSFITANAQTPVEKYGQLQIKNGKVSDKNGNPVVLRGMSLFWSGYPEGAPYYNAQTIKWLRDDWCVDIIRVPLQVDGANGSKYIDGPGTNNSEYLKVKAVIDACIANGLYVIVDYHTHYAESYKSQAKQFFTDIATAYGSKANILYEPYNEPLNNTSWSGTIKPYHNELIQTIRAKDPDNIIICGTRSWSQDVDEAANDQVTGTNIAYTLHYYAGGTNEHRQPLRDKVNAALSKGVAIFATEYGTVHQSGNGNFDANESKAWWDFLESKQIGSCNWSVTNKNETSAAILPGISAVSGWSTSQLTSSGNLVRNYIKGKCNVVVTTGSITLSFAGAKTQYKVGETVTVNATTTVANGTINKVEFFRNGISLGFANSSPYSISFTATSAMQGGHDITAKTYDSNGNLIAESPFYNISIVGSSDISTTGITDQFNSTTQYTELTGGVNGTNCATAKDAAVVGIYWWEDKDAATPFAASYVRDSVNSNITYTLSQAQNAYGVFGFSFGDYCKNGVKTKNTLNLSNNAVLKLTVSTPASNITTLDLKFQLKDINGKTLVYEQKAATDQPANSWKYDIGFSKNHIAPNYTSLVPGAVPSNFVFDFKNAVEVSFTNTFDYTQVTEVIIIPLNKEDTGPTGTPAYAPKAFSNQKIIFSGLSLGDPGLGANFCTTPTAVTVTDKTYCENATSTALTATGITGLTLKWYTGPTGGTASTVAPKPSTSTVGKTPYYVSQSVPGSSTCEGPRTVINAIVIGAPIADAGTDMNLTLGSSADLKGNGTAVGTWKLVSGPDGATVTFSPNANSATVTASGLSVIGKYNFSYTVTGTSPCTSATDDMDVNVTSITATNSNQYLKDNVEIYPNPFTDRLFVDLSKISGSKALKMVDMVGKVVFESNNEDSVNIEMTDLTKGMYIIQIQSESAYLVKSVIKK